VFVVYNFANLTKVTLIIVIDESYKHCSIKFHSTHQDYIALISLVSASSYYL